MGDEVASESPERASPQAAPSAEATGGGTAFGIAARAGGNRADVRAAEVLYDSAVERSVAAEAQLEKFKSMTTSSALRDEADTAVYLAHEDVVRAREHLAAVRAKP